VDIQLLDQVKAARFFITRPGVVYLDEWLSIALLTAVNYSAVIERRAVSEDDFRDPTRVIVNQGGQQFLDWGAKRPILHQPSAIVLDHHYLSQDAAPVCTISMVLDILGLVEIARKVWPWLRYYEIRDSKGEDRLTETVVNNLLDIMGADYLSGSESQYLPEMWQVLKPLQSPIEITMMMMFGKYRIHYPGSRMHRMLQAIGDESLNFLQSVKDRWELLSREAKVGYIKGHKWIDATCIAPQDMPSLELGRWINDYHPDAVGSITLDDKGRTLRIYRRKESPAINLHLIAGQPDVLYVHKDSKLAKLNRNANVSFLLGRATALPKEKNGLHPKP
jgi:hypothetical protein